MTPTEIQMAINMAEQGRNAEVARLLRAMIAGETPLASSDNAAITALVSDAPENASEAHALNATFSDTEVEAALNALGDKINAVAAKLNATIDAIKG